MTPIAIASACRDLARAAQDLAKAGDQRSAQIYAVDAINDARRVVGTVAILPGAQSDRVAAIATQAIDIAVAVLSSTCAKSAHRSNVSTRNQEGVQKVHMSTSQTPQKVTHCGS